MKNTGKHLDVDIVGGLGPMTKEEEKLLSEYITKKLATTKKAFTKAGVKDKS